VQIRSNIRESPDGAKGVFLLLPINWVWEAPPENPIRLDECLMKDLHLKNENLDEILKIEAELKKEYQKGRLRKRQANIQHAFEKFTERLLGDLGLTQSLTYERPSLQQISDFDFLIRRGKESVSLEVKSDKFRSTGNISLELMRDYRRSFDDPLNTGSLLKTRADLWQVYFYDTEEKKFDSRVFRVQNLLQKALEFFTLCLPD
jgi:hypothetical protein